MQELALRQERLVERCAADRAAVAREVGAIEARFAAVDRIAAFARTALINPVVIAAVAVGVLAIGRARGLGLLGRVLLLATAARRLFVAAKRL
jgi:hypothetical protein